MPGKSKDATNTAELKKFEFKKDKMQTKPYGIEDRKVKIEKLMSQKERENEMKDFKPYRADPTPKNTSAGKTALPKKLKSGGRVNLKGGGCAQIKGWGKARKR